jgi:hypothetical protein
VTRRRVEEDWTGFAWVVRGKPLLDGLASVRDDRRRDADPDGSVRVEAVSVGRRYRYRVQIDETVYEPMSIAAVEQLLAEVAIYRNDLMATPEAQPCSSPSASMPGHPAPEV